MNNYHLIQIFIKRPCLREILIDIKQFYVSHLPYIRIILAYHIHAYLYILKQNNFSLLTLFCLALQISSNHNSILAASNAEMSQLRKIEAKSKNNTKLDTIYCSTTVV